MKKFASVLLSMMLATGLAAGASAETYTGTAQGMGGDVSVTLTVEDGKITAAEVVGENETKGIGYEPCAEGTYAAAIVEAQGAEAAAGKDNRLGTDGVFAVLVLHLHADSLAVFHDQHA